MPSRLPHPDAGPLPRDLQLDLLVDAELPEDQRRTLLLSLDAQPDQWRDLAVRFLQRQVEQQSIRDLMAGGSIIPTDVVLPKSSVAGRVGSFRLLAVAAGLLIAVTSAFVTFYVMQLQPPQGSRPGSLVGGTPASEYTVRLPADTVGYGGGLSAKVPLIKTTGLEVPLAPVNNGGPAPSQRRGSFRSTAMDCAVIVPVNTLKTKVY